MEEVQDNLEDNMEEDLVRAVYADLYASLMQSERFVDFVKRNFEISINMDNEKNEVTLEVRERDLVEVSRNDLDKKDSIILKA